jgi:hypothetical protein
MFVSLRWVNIVIVKPFHQAVVGVDFAVSLGVFVREVSDTPVITFTCARQLDVRSSTDDTNLGRS